MHELSLAQAIVDQVTQVAKDNDSPRVSSVTVRIGPLAGVYKDSLEFCFPICAEKTRAEGARLIIEDVPLVLKCSDCQKESTPAHAYLLRCSECTSQNVQVISGKEFKIVGVEIE